MRPASLALAALAALATTLTVATGAFSGPAAPRRPVTALTARVGISLGPAAMRFGRSIGSPTEGHLLGGAHLLETDYLRIEPNDTAGDVRWGLEPLVSMLDRAARSVRKQFPGTVTSVGHLSREGGGDIDRHRSHESGRDADVSLFVRAAGTAGRQLFAPHFVAFRADGTAPTWPGAYFDDARNWAFVAALVGDEQAHVTHIFVASPLRARLLAYAERAGIAADTRMRAAELMQQPHGVLPHDDHFHVRIGCPAHMGGCVENPAPRSRPSPVLVARGHRGAPSRALVTPAPKRSATPATSPFPAETSPPAEDGEEPGGEPAAPPASMTLPIDDVDG